MFRAMRITVRSMPVRARPGSAHRTDEWGERSLFAESSRWAEIVLRRRWTVIVAMVGGLLALGAYGLGLGDI